MSKRICTAGAVIAGTLAEDPHIIFTVATYRLYGRDNVVGALNALENVRTNDLTDAYGFLGIDVPSEEAEGSWPETFGSWPEFDRHIATLRDVVLPALIDFEGRVLGEADDVDA